MGKKITLTLPDKLLASIKREKEVFSYFSIQEVIIATLRDRFMRNSNRDNNKSKLGRPPLLDEIAILGRKKIFSKKGVAVD